MPLLTVKAGEAEYARWKARAADAGLHLSGWVRATLNGALGGGGGSFPPPAGAGPVRGGAGPAGHSGASPARSRAGGETAPEPAERTRAARSSDREVRYTPSAPVPPATGEGAPDAELTANGAPSPATCAHPPELRRRHGWGTTCACGARVR